VVQVTSEFSVTMTRRVTPNSHDQYREARQTDKATVQLAANSKDPAIRKLLVELLREFQPEVDESHNDPENNKLKAELRQKADVRNAVVASRLSEKKRLRKLDAEAKQAAKEAKAIQQVLTTPAAIGDKRLRRAVQSFSDLEFDDADRKPAKLASRKDGAEDEQCEVCYLELGKLQGICSHCGGLAHFACHGIKPTSEEFFCRNCRKKLQDAADKAAARQQTKSEEAAELKSTFGADADDSELSEPPPSDIEESQSEFEEKIIEDEAVDEVQDDSDSDSDDEFTAITDAERLRDDMIDAKNEIIEMKTEDLKQFMDEEQPNDDVRQRLALLSCEPGKTWSEKDLEDEGSLRLALHLLLNKIQGREVLHFTKSIHIKYWAFPADVVATMESSRLPTENQIKIAAKRAR
jgi:hypothetical protein